VVIRTVAETDELQHLYGALVAIGRLRRAATVEQRQLDVVERRRARQQVEPLEDEPDLLVAHGASASFDMRDTSWPSRKYCPEVGRSRQPTMCMKVDLPEPEVPVTARNSPGWTSRLTPRSAFTWTSPTT